MGLITIVWPFRLSEEAKHAARTSAGFIEALVGHCQQSSTLYTVQVQCSASYTYCAVVLLHQARRGDNGYLGYAHVARGTHA